MIHKFISKNLSLNSPVIPGSLSKTAVFLSLFSFSFLIPFLLGHHQWLVGTAVNAFLFLAVIFLPNKFILTVILLPSLGVFSRGIIFGPFTFFLAYFLPFVWISNLILVFVFKRFFSKLNYFFSVFSASFFKSLFLFLSASLFFKFDIVPSVFLQLMGLNQFLTALLGGTVSWILFNIWKSLKTKKINK